MQASEPELPGRGSKRAGIVLLILGCAPILLDQVLPPLGIPAAVLAIWLLLKRQGQSLAVVGVVRPARGWSRTALMGVGGAALMLLLGRSLYPVLQGLIGAAPQDISSWEGVEGNTGLLAIFLAVSWTTAGFGEELIFRGFLMAGLARCFGAGRGAWVAAVLISSFVFGLIHLRTGAGGVLSTGLNGALLAGLYLLNRRRIWAPYFAHGLADTVEFLLLYSGRYGILG